MTIWTKEKAIFTFCIFAFVLWFNWFFIWTVCVYFFFMKLKSFIWGLSLILWLLSIYTKLQNIYTKKKLHKKTKFNDPSMHSWNSWNSILFKLRCSLAECICGDQHSVLSAIFLKHCKLNRNREYICFQFVHTHLCTFWKMFMNI